MASSSTAVSGPSSGDGEKATVLAKAIGDGIEIVDIDKKRGRGVRATRGLNEGEILYSNRPDIAVLYTGFVKTHCAICFRGRTALAKAKVPIEVCQECENFAVCSSCSPDPDRQTSPQWRAHSQVCRWFMSLDRQTRQGDTDYIRFLLEYCARGQSGDIGLLKRITDCCALEELHSAETKSFCHQYATITTQHFGPKGLKLPYEGLRDVLMRVKANALGFPCDSKEIYGWAMESDICALNHSCAPNATIDQGSGGEMIVRVTRPISEGEEVTISYIQTADFADTNARRRHLLEKYRFLCMCEVCAPAAPASGAPSSA